jgi:UDP-GlcNAc:undecaprenyl-phosphate/decaprenyl-phosphate GlcNAc-1-phosphate transferase
MTSVATALLAAALAAAFSALAWRLPGPRAHPLPERWHRTVTPVTGGIALFAAFALALQPALGSGAIPTRYQPVVLAAVAAFALGLWDDVRRVSVPTKLVGQLAIAVGAAMAGVRPDWVDPSLGIPLACVVMVACMNSLNLLDNMDGLAAGTAAVATLGLALVGGLLPHAGSPVVAAALAGACLGFLPFNYRPRRPAALFMGDSGSQLLGLTLGALALLASPGGAGGVAAAIAAPLLILAVPVLDTGLVMLVRFGEGRPLWQGGCDHSSHRLVYRGMTERRAVAVLLGIAALCTTTAIALVVAQNAVLTGVAGAAALVGLGAFAARLALVKDHGVVAGVASEVPVPAGRSAPPLPPVQRGAD